MVYWGQSSSCRLSEPSYDVADLGQAVTQSLGQAGLAGVDMSKSMGSIQLQLLGGKAKLTTPTMQVEGTYEMQPQQVLLHVLNQPVALVFPKNQDGSLSFMGIYTLRQQ